MTNSHLIGLTFALSAVLLLMGQCALHELWTLYRGIQGFVNTYYGHDTFWFADADHPNFPPSFQNGF